MNLEQAIRYLSLAQVLTIAACCDADTVDEPPSDAGADVAPTCPADELGELCAQWCAYRVECSTTTVDEAACLEKCPTDRAGAIYNAVPECESVYFAHLKCVIPLACDEAWTTCKKYHDAIAACNNAVL